MWDYMDRTPVSLGQVYFDKLVLRPQEAGLGILPRFTGVWTMSPAFPKHLEPKLDITQCQALGT